MCDLAIRQAQPEDAKALLACLSQIGSESENLSFGPEGPGFTVAQETEYLQGLQQAEKSVLLCAWKGDTLVGTASLNALSRRMAHRAELSVSVIRSAWGQGVGSALMARLLVFARKHGVEIINLEVRSDNLRAIRLYEKYGFRRIGTSPAFFKVGGQYVDAEVMYLDLRR